MAPIVSASSVAAESLDKNKDGVVDAKEVMEGVAEGKLGPFPFVGAVPANFDKNNDGIVDDHEMAAAALEGKFACGPYGPSGVPSYGRFEMHPRYNRYIGRAGTGAYYEAPTKSARKGGEWVNSWNRQGMEPPLTAPAEGPAPKEEETATRDWMNFAFCAQLNPYGPPVAYPAVPASTMDAASQELRSGRFEYGYGWSGLAAHQVASQPLAPYAWDGYSSEVPSMDKNHDGLIDNRELAAAVREGKTLDLRIPVATTDTHVYAARLGAPQETGPLDKEVLRSKSPKNVRLQQRNAAAVEKHVRNVSPTRASRPALRPASATDVAYAAAIQRRSSPQRQSARSRKN